MWSHLQLAASRLGPTSTKTLARKATTCSRYASTLASLSTSSWSKAIASQSGKVENEMKLLKPSSTTFRSLSSGGGGFGGGYPGQPMGNIFNQGQQQQQSYLEQFTVDLTKIAREKGSKMDPIIGRDTEIRRSLQILARRTKNNPVLIGHAGVGKTAIAEGLASRIVSGQVPESMKGKRLLSLDVAGLVSGAMMRGQFEERLKGLLKEVEKAEG